MSETDGSTVEVGQLEEVGPHQFEECPNSGCDGDLQYQTQETVLCLSCDEHFCHERRYDRHLLWCFTDDLGALDEVVARAE